MATGIVYLLGDIIGGIITPNYSYIANAVSELIQSGAENRILLSLFLFVHAVLIILFAIGILLRHPYKKTKLTFIGGILLLVVGIGHSLSSTIFPMDPVGAEMTFPCIMHLVLVGITVVFILFSIPMIGQGLYRYKNWKSFRLFTFICLPVMVLAGVLSPVVIANGIEVMGVTERITGYTFYLWIFMLAYRLIKEQPEKLP
jgi:hypothetical membrane protein